MPLSFKTEIRPEHVREATSRIYWRHTVLQSRGLPALGALFVVAQGLLMALLRDLSAWWYLGFALLMLGSALGVLAHAARDYTEVALRNFRRFKDEPVTVALEAEAYRYEAAWGSGTIEWSRFQSLWCLPTVWVLLQHVENGASVLLPVQDLDADARVFLKDRMRRVKAKVVD